MGILDGIDLSGLDPELLKLLRGAQPDNKAAVNQGLMAAGLGMLANSTKGFAGGVGSGGLLGLEAYNTERQRQQKDPMQQINMLSGILGLNQTLQKSRWMQDFGGNGPQVAGAAPQAQDVPLAKLIQGMGLDIPVAKTLYEAATKQPGRFGPGDVPIKTNPYTGQEVRGEPIPNLDRGMEMGPQGVQPMAGYPQAAASIAGAQTQAQERAKAALDIVQVPDGKGGTISMPRAQAVALLGQNQPAPAAPAEIPPEIQKAWTDYVQGGGPAQGAFKVDYLPKPAAPLGAARSPEAAATAMIPIKAQEAAAIQQAQMPGQLNKALAEGLGKYSIENLSAGHKVAEEAAYGTLPAVKEVRERIAGGAFVGGTAETKTAILNTINGLFGTSIASPQVAQAMALKSALGVQLLANAKKLGYNPSDTDAKRIDDIIGRQGLSKEGLLAIADMQERWAKQSIDRHNKRLDGMEAALKERGLPTDTLAGMRVQVPEEAPKSEGKADMRQQLEAEMKRRGLLK